MPSDNPSSFSPDHSRSMPRRNSLRLPPQAPDSVPIPPSLRQSPYLNAPMFKTEIASPALPTEEDEKWLQDTVPIASPNANSSNNLSAKAQADRRGSIKQPTSRHFSTPPTIAVSPCLGSNPSSPHPNGRGGTLSQSHTQKYLAHSLAPPPMYGGCSSPGLLSTNGWQTSNPSTLSNTKSESNSPRTNSSSSSSDQGYFPRVPPMR